MKCPVCNGRGRVILSETGRLIECTNCNSTGFVSEEKYFQMTRKGRADAGASVHVTIDTFSNKLQPETDAIVLISGGMDSVTLAHYVQKKLKRNPALLFFDYGQKTLRQEFLWSLAASNDLMCPFLSITLGEIGSYVKSAIITGSPDSMKMEDTVVPGRNLLFTSFAVSIAASNNIDEVYIGVQIGDHEGYPDCRESFWSAVHSSTILGYNVAIRTPFLKKTKRQIVEIGKELGVDYRKTYSCYYNNIKPCGKCPSCRVRNEAGV